MAFPTTPVLDTFTQPDGPLGAPNWVNNAGGTDALAVLSDQVTGPGDTGAAYWVGGADLEVAEPEVYIDVGTVPSFLDEIWLLDLFARASDDLLTIGGQVILNADGLQYGVAFFSDTAESPDIYTSATPPQAIGLSIIGDQVTGYVKVAGVWSAIGASITTGVLTPGRIGIIIEAQSTSGDTTGDNFGGGESGGPPPVTPTITSFSPGSGQPGTLVTIVGTDLAGATAVAFNGAGATSFAVIDDEHVTAFVPPGATTGPITITTPDGVATSADDFTVLAAVRRFSEGFQWRFLFTDLDVVTTSMPDDLLTARTVNRALNQSAVIEMSIWPDDFRVNGLWTDGYPRIAQSNRLVFGFRREGGSPPWVCRAAGIIMAPEDTGSSDLPVSHIAAYDPWKYLEARPATNTDGTLPGPNGLFFDKLLYTSDQIVGDLLKNTILNEGGVFIDAGLTYGGTASWGGTIETCPAVSLNVQQGQSVSDVWGTLVSAGLLDIVLTPIYDPSRTAVVGSGVPYHFTHELSIFNLAGSDQHNALFAWDRLVNNLTAIDRMHDATPGSFMNVVWYFAGQGGAPVPPLNPLIDAATIAAFGRYWGMQWFPNLIDADPTGSQTLFLAQQALLLAKQGVRTMTITPIADLAPVPIRDYDLGDRVPIYASAALRVTADGLQRVQAMPIQIDDNGVETVAGLLCSADWRGEPS